MSETKQSGIEWLGEIPKEWKVGRIKNIVSQYGSGTTPGSGNELYYDEGSHFWIQSGDLYNTTYITDTQKKITDLALANCKSLQKYISDFIVIAMYGASIGNVSISKIDAYVNQACYCLKTNKNNDLKFLYYGIDACKENLLANSFGGTQPNINSAIIRNQTIVIPQLSEQTAIADFLDDKCGKIDTLIENQENVIAELKEYKKSIIQKAITKGITNAKLKDSGVEWLGEIPEKWEIKRLKYIVELDKKRLTEKTPADYEFRYIDISSVDYYEGIMGYQEIKFSDAPSRARMIVSKNDIIVSTVRTYLRAISLIKDADNVIVSTGFAILSPNTIMINPDYLSYYCKSDIFCGIVESLSYGTSYPAINSGTLVDIKIPVPPVIEQKAIAEYLDKKTKAVDNLIAIKKQKIAELKEYKKSLIYDYVTGKKAVV